MLINYACSFVGYVSAASTPEEPSTPAICCCCHRDFQDDAVQLKYLAETQTEPCACAQRSRILICRQCVSQLHNTNGFECPYCKIATPHNCCVCYRRFQRDGSPVRGSFSCRNLSETQTEQCGCVQRRIIIICSTRCHRILHANYGIECPMCRKPAHSQAQQETADVPARSYPLLMNQQPRSAWQCCNCEQFFENGDGSAPRDDLFYLVDIQIERNEPCQCVELPQQRFTTFICCNCINELQNSGIDCPYCRRALPSYRQRTLENEASSTSSSQQSPSRRDHLQRVEDDINEAVNSFRRGIEELGQNSCRCSSLLIPCQQHQTPHQQEQMWQSLISFMRQRYVLHTSNERRNITGRNGLQTRLTRYENIRRYGLGSN